MPKTLEEFKEQYVSGNCNGGWSDQLIWAWGCENFQEQIDQAGVEIHCPSCKTKIEIESVEW